MAKILHISDMHLDSKNIELDEEKRELRRFELKKSFANAVDFAVQNGVEIMLIAGDVFDNPYAKTETIEFFKKTINSVPNIKIFISAGNHDPYTNNVYKHLENGLLSHIKIFKNAMECVELKDLNTRVYGRGFDSEIVKNPLLKGFVAPNDEMINLMVIHGDVANNQSDYNPIMLDDIKNSNLDYIALGHTHTFSQINKVGDTFYAYSGTHEGHGFDECDEKGVIFGDVSKKNVDLKFVKTSIRQYKTIEIDVTDCKINEEIIEKIKPFLNDTDIFKFILTGYKNEDLTISDVAIKADLNAFFVKIYDETKLKIDFLQISKEENLRGICVRKILENTTEENKETMDKVLKYIANVL